VTSSDEAVTVSVNGTSCNSFGSFFFCSCVCRHKPQWHLPQNGVSAIHVTIMAPGTSHGLSFFFYLILSTFYLDYLTTPFHPGLTSTNPRPLQVYLCFYLFIFCASFRIHHFIQLTYPNGPVSLAIVSTILPPDPVPIRLVGRLSFVDRPSCYIRRPPSLREVGALSLT